MKNKLLSVSALVAFALTLVFNVQAIRTGNGEIEISSLTSVQAQSIDPPTRNCIDNFETFPGIPISRLSCNEIAPGPNVLNCGYTDIANPQTYSTCSS